MGKREREAVDIEKFSQFVRIHTKQETALEFGLTLKDVDCLKGKLKIKCKSYFWVTNGTENMKVKDESLIPEGFYRGRVAQQSTTKGRVWVTDGSINRLVLPFYIPEGFYMGKSFSSTKGYKTYNDGKINYVLSPEHNVPSHFVLGRVNTENYKKAAFRRKVVRYNDGRSNFKGNSIPEGCFEGWLTRKQLRDIEFDEKGYVPLSKNLHLLSAYVKLKDQIETISFKEPFVYIAKQDIPKLEEYTRTNHSRGTSFTEELIVNEIKTFYKGEIIRNIKKVITPQELDIYLPEEKLAIEYNGTYWHSTLPKDYHLKKSIACRELGIHLIHIYEFEDLEEQLQLVESILKHKNVNYIRDFNKDNLRNIIPEPCVIYKDKYFEIYGAGPILSS